MATSSDCVAPGDFNGDGNADVASMSTSGVGGVLLGRGDGTFAPAVLLPAELTDAGPHGVQIRSLAAGRLGSGPSDSLVVCDGYGQIDLLALALDGGWRRTAAFGGAMSWDAGVFIEPVATAVADFNGDGLGDIAVADMGGPGASGIVDVLFGSDAGYALATFPAGSEPYALAVADFNHDGLPDIAVMQANRSVGVLWNEGDGGFAPLAYVGLNGGGQDAQEGHLWTLDLDGDGNPDLVTSGWSLLYGDGQGHFTEVDLPVTDQLLSPGEALLEETLLSVADFNHDGFADLAGAVRTFPAGTIGLDLWFGSSTRGSFTEWGNSYLIGGTTYGAGYQTSWTTLSLRPDAGPDAVYAAGLAGGNSASGVVGLLPDICAAP